MEAIDKIRVNGTDYAINFNTLENSPFEAHKEVLLEQNSLVPEVSGFGEGLYVVDTEEGDIIEYGFIPTVGKTYIVNWNGTEYSCKAYIASQEAGMTTYALGNLSLGGMPAGNTDAPFVFSAEVGECQLYSTLVNPLDCWLF